MANGNDARRRLILSQHMVDILRPSTAVDLKLVPNERLVAYAIAIGVYQDRPMGLHKLHEMTGLARSTVRGVVERWTARGWVVRLPDLTFAFSEEFLTNADDWFNLEFKYQTILRSADLLREAGNHTSKEEL